MALNKSHFPPYNITCLLVSNLSSCINQTIKSRPSQLLHNQYPPIAWPDENTSHLGCARLLVSLFSGHISEWSNQSNFVTNIQLITYPRSGAIIACVPTLLLTYKRLLATYVHLVCCNILKSESKLLIWSSPNKVPWPCQSFTWRACGPPHRLTLVGSINHRGRPDGERVCEGGSAAVTSSTVGSWWRWHIGPVGLSVCLGCCCDIGFKVGMALSPLLSFFVKCGVKPPWANSLFYWSRW